MFCSALLVALVAADPAPQTFPLWTGKVPHAVGDSAADKPELTAYRPEKPNGTAVVVCPGGGYGGLAMDHEGKQVGEFFAKIGVTAFVLKYRTANKDRPGRSARRRSATPSAPSASCARRPRSTTSTRSESGSWASPPAGTSPAPRPRTSTPAG